MIEIVKMKNLFEFKGRLSGGEEDINQPTLVDIFKGFLYRVIRKNRQSNKRVSIDINNPKLTDINDALNIFESIPGYLYLEQYKQKGLEPYKLTLYLQNQKYMVMFAYINI